MRAFCSSFFQSLCVLGYCILPLTVAMIVCRLVLLGGTGPASFAIRLILVIASFGWSTFACQWRLEVRSDTRYQALAGFFQEAELLCRTSTAFLADSQPPSRKALVVYPIFLFYFVIGWMILTFAPSHGAGP
ncbi:hypothetical protein JZ751_020115 [Albula glossodonta]|uniref:Uncharacterized protein n=1 Tax=Albula glossodonta TaxID=121402 RepID=A0A8T2NTJ4_9TELE|nr:hypothetical protein JZ751_020115 [Albula glossodonta]